MIQMLQARSGVRYAISGKASKKPAPLFVNLASGLDGTLKSEIYGVVGQILEKKGFLSATFDAPSHGTAQRKGEPPGLDGWRSRLEKGEPLIEDFNDRARDVLDDLIDSGRVDPHRIAVCGVSRYGFMALHFAAADPRVKCAVAIAPVTHLPALREFRGMEPHAPTRQLSLSRLAPKLAGLPIWMVIGNADDRVDTSRAIEFADRVIEESSIQGKPCKMELHVVEAPGHAHPTASLGPVAPWIVSHLSQAGEA